MKQIETEVQDGGVLLRYDGGNRFITEAEVAEMCRNDAPVTVK